jgi:hypothetical protein
MVRQVLLVLLVQQAPLACLARQELQAQQEWQVRQVLLDLKVFKD